MLFSPQIHTLSSFKQDTLRNLFKSLFAISISLNMTSANSFCWLVGSQRIFFSVGIFDIEAIVLIEGNVSISVFFLNL